MKGVIVDCLREMVIKQHGKETWDDVLQKAGITTSLTVYSTVDDQIVMNVIRKLCQKLHITIGQAADAFGDYWVNHYALRKFKVYYTRAKNAKEFISNMDKVHITMTNTIKDAHPPRFDYQWKNDKSLVITYKSKRNMIDFAVSLLKGVGKYYKEDIKVFKMGVNKIHVNFP